MVTPSTLYHIRHQFRGDRRPTLVLLILPGIRKQGQYRSDPFCASDLASVDHYAELHECGVDRTAAGVDDVHIIFADRLGDADARFSDPAFRDLRFRQGEPDADENRIRDPQWKGAKKTTGAL